MSTSIRAGLLGQVVYLDIVNLDEESARGRLLSGVLDRLKPTEAPQYPGPVHTQPEAPAFPGKPREQGVPEGSQALQFVLLLTACSTLALDVRIVWPTLGERRRTLALVAAHQPHLRHQAPEVAAELDVAAGAGFGALVQSFVTESLPAYVEITELHLRSLEGTAAWLKDDDEFQHERKVTWEAFYAEWERIKDTLEATRVFALPIAEQRARGDEWKALGFETKFDFTEYLRPTMRSLTASPGEMGEHVLERLLHGPLSLTALEEEAIPEDVRIDLLNRVLEDSWAKLEGDLVSLTPAGKELLPKRLKSWREPRR